MEEVYHVCNKSIAGYVIFNDTADYLRMMSMLKYYQLGGLKISYSYFMRLPEEARNAIIKGLRIKNGNIVDIIAYCIMPTHLHFLLRPREESSVSAFMNNILNSYTKYFNGKHNRKGPLWEGPSSKIIIENDYQLLHVTRYIHLNPVTAYLVNSPEDWPYSSYEEYIHNHPQICHISPYLDLKSLDYAAFARGGIEYQRSQVAAKEAV
jgi:putative transposase